MVIVGANGDDDKGSNSGSAYIFESTDSDWIPIAKLTASDGTTDDSFGRSVSISGNVAVVGAHFDDDQGTNSGSAYVFHDSESGWNQVSKLMADDGAANDWFGYSVSMSGDRVLVGAFQDDDKGADAGSAYLFEDTGSGWILVSKFTANDGAAGDYFGYSVSISGTMAVAGVYGDDDKGSSSCSAYVFNTVPLLTEDTGCRDDDQITCDTTPILNVLFSEPAFGEDDGIVVLDPNNDQVSPDSIIGWGTNMLVIGFETPLAVDGEYTVTLGGNGAITDAAGNPLGGELGHTLTFTLDTSAPTAAHVLVKGSAWTDAFLDWLDAQDLGVPGAARLGYRVPGGGGQFDSLGWGNIDMVSIAFSEDVVVTQNHVTLAGVNVAEYTITGFSYDPATYVATWTLAQPIAADRIAISLSDDVEDIAGNALDGEWHDAQSQFPSGDGEPGGHFGFGFHVLPGDANRDGAVNAVDASIMAAHFGRTGATARVGDFDGNGTVDADDAKILAAHWGTTLPPIPEGSPIEPVVDEPITDEPPSIDPVAAIDAAFVGPLPIGNLPSTRQPIQPVQRIGRLGMPEQRAYALRSPDLRSPEELLIETTPDSSTAALDTALAEEYGPAQVGHEPTTALFNRHAAWSSMVARRQSNRRDAGDLGRAESAVDLLMAGR
ncbi:MAG TPA: hypothetical protein DD670_18690 [Planctomycetaceae bacterium]|nr:hypothetical protein [Planctomycetaceae bacterium]